MRREQRFGEPRHRVLTKIGGNIADAQPPSCADRSIAKAVLCGANAAACWRSQVRYSPNMACRGQVVAVVQREQQVAMCDGVVGPRGQCLAAALFGFGMPALRLQCDRQIGQHAMALRSSWQRGAMMRLCLDRSARLGKHCAESVVRFRIIGIDRQCLPQRGFGAIRRTARDQAQRQAAQQPWLVRRLAQCLDQYLFCFVGTMLIEQYVAEVAQCRRKTGLSPSA